jgi:hypothetical protein
MAGYVLLGIGIFAIIVVMSFLFASAWKYRRDVIATVDPDAPKLEMSLFDNLAHLSVHLMLWSLLIGNYFKWISFEVGTVMGAVLLIMNVYVMVVMLKKNKRYVEELERYQKTKSKAS